MTIKTKMVEVFEGAVLVARVEAETTISLPEEDLLRKLLRKYYATHFVPFSSMAMQVTGAVILFRAIPNCKHPPKEADVVAVLQFMDLIPDEPTPKPARKRIRPKSPAKATHRQARATA